MSKYKIIENPKKKTLKAAWEKDAEYMIEVFKKVLNSDKFSLEIQPDYDYPDEPIFYVVYHDPNLEKKVKTQFDKYNELLVKEFIKHGKSCNVLF